MIRRLGFFLVFIAAAAAANAQYSDPCQRTTRIVVPISTTTSVQLITGATGKQIHVCHADLVSATAQNVALVEGTGSVCATNTAGMAGGATAATGWNFAANAIFVVGDGGWWIYQTQTAADNVCLLLSGTGQVSGSISYVPL